MTKTSMVKIKWSLVSTFLVVPCGRGDGEAVKMQGRMAWTETDWGPAAPDPQRRGRTEGLAGRRDDAEVEQSQGRSDARGASEEEEAQRPGSNGAGFCRRRHRAGFARRRRGGMVGRWRRGGGARVPPMSPQRERRGGWEYPLLHICSMIIFFMVFCINEMCTYTYFCLFVF
jgi:hypothetical protein